MKAEDFTAEYNRALAKSRDNNPFKLARKRLENVHTYTNTEFRWLDPEIGEVIGQDDVDNRNIMIPYIDVDADPYKAFESNWYIETSEDAEAIKQAPNYMPPTGFRPVICHMVRHQNPCYGFYRSSLRPTATRPYAFTKPMERRMSWMFNPTNIDHSKLWRIECYAVPVAQADAHDFFHFTGVDGYWSDKQFGFGVKVRMMHYAYYDKVRGKFVSRGKRKRLRETDDPVFVYGNVVRYRQLLYASGAYTEQEIKDNLMVVRYHIHPVKSYQWHPKYNFLHRAYAMKEYREGNVDIIKHNALVFRFHIKQQQKLRKKL